MTVGLCLILQPILGDVATEPASAQSWGSSCSLRTAAAYGAMRNNTYGARGRRE
jgi:hypothetical protein